MKTVGYIFGTLACLLGIAALGFYISGVDLAMYKFFAPKYEAARRNVFEQSKAYRQGNVQELMAEYRRYLSASPEHKAAIASMVRHQFADFDRSAIQDNVELLAFLNRCMSATAQDTSSNSGRF